MAVIQFVFAQDVVAHELEEILAVAQAATEGLVGSAVLVIESPARIEPDSRTITIDATSEAGQSLARVVASLAERTVGRGVFRVVRSESPAEGLHDSAGVA